MLRNARVDGVGGYKPKRYKALRGGVGGLCQHYVTSFFLRTLLGLPSCPRVRRGFHDNLASISNNMFLCIMLTTKTCSHFSVM